MIPYRSRRSQKIRAPGGEWSVIPTCHVAQMMTVIDELKAHNLPYALALLS